MNINKHEYNPHIQSQLSTAYAVLSDPNKKRQYDLHGEGDGGAAELSSINVDELGTVGRCAELLLQLLYLYWYLKTSPCSRLFGALISKAGIPVPTEITQKVLTAAQVFISYEWLSGWCITIVFQHLGAGKTKADVPGFDLPNVEDLLWGQVRLGSVS